VFYFGNAVGDSGAGNAGGYALVDQADETAVRANKTGFAPAVVTNLYDFNRDRRVSASDELTARYLPAGESTALRLIALSSGGAALMAMAAPDDTASDSTGILPSSTGISPVREASPVTAVPPNSAATKSPTSAHDAALSAATWLWAYEWEQIATRKTSTRKDPTAVSAVDRVLAANWV
jgi:hypothetical protein